ncbi:MAG: nucleoside deaminase [Candidatus Melainabacteria bacterium]|nr:nucleoside deaminase [Candidatus Melainabacteria bacterium]
MLFSKNRIASCLATIFTILSCSSLSAQAGEQKYFGDKYDTDFTQVTHYDCDEPYNSDLEPLVKKDLFSYIQPWSGYCNKSDRPEDEAKRLPCQTSNIKPSLKYAGVEVIGNKWMRLACEHALKSVQNGGGPFSTVIVQIDDDSKKAIRYWISHNAVVMWKDPTAHGEVTAIRQACKELNVINLGRIEKSDPNLKLPQPGATSHCELYTSAEPCPMCYCATRWARIDKIFFSATVYDAATQGVNFSDEPIYAEMSLNYADRKKMGSYCYQCTLDNSLDAFNHYKRSAAGKY